MSPSDLALVASAGSVLVTALGLVVACASLRLSAASVPLDFRLRLDGRGTPLGDSKNLNYWARGLLINQGTSCKISSFAVIDWEGPAPLGQAPYLSTLDELPRPETQRDKRKTLGGRVLSKRADRTERLFYPQTMPTGGDLSVYAWLPPNVKRFEVSVEVSYMFAGSRSHSFWVESPSFSPRDEMSDK